LKVSIIIASSGGNNNGAGAQACAIGSQYSLYKMINIFWRLGALPVYGALLPNNIVVKLLLLVWLNNQRVFLCW
jgi:hypothetical protein